MPSRYDRASELAFSSLDLALVPVVATLLSFSELSRALATQGGVGVTFPFPTGLPTLWTYVALPGVTGGVPIGGQRTLLPALAMFVLGLLLVSALEAGFLGALVRRLDGDPGGFAAGLSQFTVRMVGVNLVRLAVILLALPFLTFPPLALAIVLVVSYFVYGLPFVVVAGDRTVADALGTTVGRAGSGGAYASFGFAHLVLGMLGSILLTWLVRNAAVLGIVLGIVLVAVPAVFVASYGLFVFRDLEGEASPAGG